jgi:hypothetical protein
MATGPDIVPGAEGRVLSVTGSKDAAPVQGPTELVATTVIFPEPVEDAAVTVIDVPPCPEAMLPKDEGTVQVYEFAPLTDAIEYIFPVELLQRIAEPLIAPKGAGAGFTVTE